MSGAHRVGHRRLALRRHAQLHGRRLEARLRLRAVRRPAAVRVRPFPHDDRRTLPHLGPCAGVRRPLRLRESHPRADQERRRPHQAQPLGRHHGAGLGPPLALVPARGRAARRRSRSAGSASFKVMAHATNPGGGEERDPARRAQRRARLHHGRRVHRAAARARHLVRADARHQPSDRRARPATSGSAAGSRSATSRLRCAAAPTRPRTCTRAWFRKALDAGVQDGARLRHPAAQGRGAAGDGAVGAATARRRGRRCSRPRSTRPRCAASAPIWARWRSASSPT